jgi:ribosome biogenesis GTPase / thiamine phosphate phosphatase
VDRRDLYIWPGDAEMTDQLRGVIHETGGGVYAVVLSDGRRVEASLRGRLKQEARTGSRVVIGDRVTISPAGDTWTIEAVEERTAELVRRGRSARVPKILAANLDRVFVVVALRDPAATTQLVDRLLVLVEASGMHPTLVLNKVDLEGARNAANELRPLYERAGYRVIVVSAESAEGLEDLHSEMCSGSSAFIGPSGAGKSTLLNAIDPALDLRTGELSRKTGTGRHTTVGSRLIDLECGGVVADTPGFGDVGLWSVASDEVADCFPEFGQVTDPCRFRGCTHLHEPQCAIREALEAGAISTSRYESYRTLRSEAEEAAQPGS